MTASTLIECSFKLPQSYRAKDILRFNQRDPLAIAESVDQQALSKGLLWYGQPARLAIQFKYNAIADVQLSIDGLAHKNDESVLQQIASRLLGLTQDIEAFELAYKNHPQIGLLIAQNPGLRVPTCASFFEAITWAITGQQISVSAAVSIRRKLIQLVGVEHSSGLLCYPDAQRVIEIEVGALRQLGYSGTKVEALLGVSEMVIEHQALLACIPTEETVTAIYQRLSEIKGIGPWTINYGLLRGLGWLDGALQGDAGVRRSLQTLLSQPEKLTEPQAQHWLAPFKPWRALVAAHLWQYDHPIKLV